MSQILSYYNKDGWIVQNKENANKDEKENALNIK